MAIPLPKTPGVYIDEIPLFPPSVAEVESAIPAFVGYTEIAERDKANDLVMKATRIRSMRQFEQYYGFPPKDPIVITAVKATAPDQPPYEITDIQVGTAGADGLRASYLLYYALQMFFDNGGGDCYIVSVGVYPKAISDADLALGLAEVAREDEPTLLVVPDAVKLGSFATYGNVVDKMQQQCALLGDRFAVIDVFHGHKEPDATEALGGGVTETLIKANRGKWLSGLKYSAAYYPFVKTTFPYYLGPADDSKMGDNVSVKVGTTTTKLDVIRSGASPDTALYNTVIRALREHFVDMPASGAIVGAYATTDTRRGVWKAPANVPLSSVLEPMVKLDNGQQDGLNIDADTGKSVNALRAYAGKGTLIWGARTLAGNDNEWRYVPVRRFFNMVEESVKKSTYWAVFEPNDANTWVKVRGMIENYLTQKWREGALAGATTKEAFFVRCSLGTTMTAQDILEGRMYVEIGMAVVRPAEFIILRFYHKLQTS